MKKGLLCFIFVLITIASFANGQEYFQHVKKLYDQGRYEEAIQGFEICKEVYSDELSTQNMDQWIAKCNKAINDKKIKAEAARKAGAAAYAKKQRLRRERKLVYISAYAYSLTKDFPSFQSSIAKSVTDAGYKCTPDPEVAYLTVYVSALSEKLENTDPKNHYVTITVSYQIMNMDGEILAEDVYYDKVGSRRSYEDASVQGLKDYTVKLVKEKITESLKN